jgi:hypothetical protein
MAPSPHGATGEERLLSGPAGGNGASNAPPAPRVEDTSLEGRTRAAKAALEAQKQKTAAAQVRR